MEIKKSAFDPIPVSMEQRETLRKGETLQNKQEIRTATSTEEPKALTIIQFLRQP